MGFFKWLYRLPGRIERNMEKTAVASSVVESEGMGGTHVDVTAMKSALGEMEGSGQREGDSSQGEGQ